MELQERLDIIHSVCLRFAQNSEHDLEDLEHEAWIASHEKEDGALIRVCTYHTCVDLFRKQRRRREKEQAFAELHSHDVTEPSDSFAKLDLESIMNRVIASGILSPAEQELLWRYYYCSETFREIAEIASVAASTVKNKLFFIEEKLRSFAKMDGGET